LKAKTRSSKQELERRFLNVGRNPEISSCRADRAPNFKRGSTSRYAPWMKGTEPSLPLHLLPFLSLPLSMPPSFLPPCATSAPSSPHPPPLRHAAARLGNQERGGVDDRRILISMERAMRSACIRCRRSLCSRGSVERHEGRHTSVLLSLLHLPLFPLLLLGVLDHRIRLRATDA
jgi:hypothetical protein